MSIENLILAHFRHFSSLFTNLPSTIVENPLQIGLFLQNKAKVNIGKMNVSIVTIKDYGKNNEQSTTNVIQNKAKVTIGNIDSLSVVAKVYPPEAVCKFIRRRRGEDGKFTRRRRDKRQGLENQRIS